MGGRRHVSSAGLAAGRLLAVLGAWEAHPPRVVANVLAEAGPVMVACLEESGAWGALTGGSRVAVVLGMQVSADYERRTKTLPSWHVDFDVPVVRRGLGLARVASRKEGQLVLPRALLQLESDAEECARRFGELSPHWRAEAMRMVLSGNDVAQVIARISFYERGREPNSAVAEWVAMLESEESR